MKRSGRIWILIFLFAALIAALSGCSADVVQDGTRVTGITLTTSEVSIASYGENNTFQIYPTVAPATALNQKVVFQLASIQDSAYVSVSDTGLVTGLDVQADTEKKPIEIIVKSVDNPKARASLFVTVENVAVERVYFEPRVREVYIDQEPFTAKATYTPAHAAEGTTLTYTTSDATIATVDQITGTITVLSRGTACITATNPSGISDCLLVTVLMTKPSYRLLEAPASVNSYNQVPGKPEKITYTLVPGFNNDPDCRIRWTAESKEIVSNRDKLTYEYTPSADLMPKVYNVEVEIKDSDDQVQIIKSKDINVYYSFTGLKGLEFDTEKEYFVSDFADAIPVVNEDEQRPEAYLWFERVLVGGETDELLSRYENYRQVGTSQYAANGGRYAYRPEHGGEIILAVVPVVNNAPVYAALTRTKPFTVHLLSRGNPYYNVDFSAIKDGGETLLRLDWGFMPGESVFVVEIDAGADRMIVQSTDPAYEKYFTETSFTVPASLHAVSKSATFRLRTSRFAFGDEIRYNASDTEQDAALIQYNKPVEGLPFTYYAKSMSEVGDLFNYIRFFRPGAGNYAPATEGIEYRYNATAADGYLHGFTFTLAFGFDYNDVDTARYDKTKSPFDRMSAFYIQDKDLPAGASEKERNEFRYFKADYNEIVDKALSAFLAYGESGSISISIKPVYNGTTGSVLNLGSRGTYTMPLTDTQTHRARITLNLKDEPDASTLKSDQSEMKQKELAGYVPLVSGAPRGEAYDDYFVKNTGEMEVFNGQQLYLAAVWGKKPVPAEGSAADGILRAAKSAMNSILGEDIETETQKIKAIHDYIVVNINYDYDLAGRLDADALSYGFCLEGVFIDQYAVCDGLSKAVALMAWMEGLPSFKISGVVPSSGIGHAWNKVLIDGTWKLIDTTWDSTLMLNNDPNVITVSSAYFLKTDKDEGFRENIDRRTYGEYPAAK